jgi:hypothetical protein
VIAHSPRLRDGQSYRRRPAKAMKYFVFHEFHNSSRNTDVFDTISSHSGPVFVPLYLSKQATDARGNRFVSVVQVAPHTAVSIHATNHGSAGPGVEVAKNATDPSGAGRQSSWRRRATDAGCLPAPPGCVAQSFGRTRVNAAVHAA